ncbi:MAG: PLP-dependent aminotransferase family protein [Gammaproteobacteria bacterium]|nr:PLP-dependent aminotransferase family protein [Gammaproteobacteria bacterium]
MTKPLGTATTFAPAVDVEFSGLILDARKDESLHRQLYQHLRQRILNGELPYGTRLPATRRLARDLEVSRNTVVAAFEQLVAEGYLASRTGEGTTVAAQIVVEPQRGAGSNRDAPTMQLGERGQALSVPIRGLRDEEALRRFQPGIPDITDFPRTTWGRLMGRRARAASDGLTGYGHPGGFAPLRQSLATYLSTARGVRCAPEQVLVTTSAQASLDLAARMLTDPGQHAWMESPGYGGARASFSGAGLIIHPIEVDADGACVAQLKTGAMSDQLRIGYITPSHQYPTGHTLSLQRRLDVLDWSASSQGWILEDDYDSEFRYANAPIAAVQGLANHSRVIYVGSFSKTLFPGLRVAYMVVPTALANEFRQALRQTGQEPPLVNQAALHDFIEQGYFARHIRHVRTVYSQRRTALLKAMEEHLSSFGAPIVADGGLQLTFALNPRHPRSSSRASGQ